MKINIKREEFLKSLTDIQYVVDKKSSIAVLNHFLLRAYKDRSLIIATDLETAIKEPINLEILEEGQYCIPGKKLLEIAKELENDISIEIIEEGWVRIRSGKTNFRLTCLSADDFPKWPEIEARNSFNLSQKDLLDMISKTIYAAGEADTRYVLNSLLFNIKQGGIMNVVGTDGHRLAMYTKKIEFDNSEEIKLIVSRKSVAEVRRALTGEGDIQMCIEKNHLLFKIGDKEVLGRLVDGSFPNYENVIPVANDRLLTVQREGIAKCLRMASIIGKEKTNIVVFDIGPSSMTVSASNPEIGEFKDELPVKFTGEPIRIAFSARLLLESINVIESENVLIKMKEPLTPVLIVSDREDEYRSVVMPVRL